MSKNTHCAPLTFSAPDPSVIGREEIRENIITTRVVMVQNLVRIAESLTQKIESTNSLQTQLELSNQVRKLYVEINQLMKHLDDNLLVGITKNELEFSEKASPFLDFKRRKQRAQVWKDYLAWCGMNNIDHVKKGELFDSLLDYGFRESVTAGSVTLVPPGVR